MSFELSKGDRGVVFASLASAKIKNINKHCCLDKIKNVLSTESAFNPIFTNAYYCVKNETEPGLYRKIFRKDNVKGGIKYTI
jgi:hypothetical protein